MANIVLKTYAAGDNNQGSVTPQNDALIYQAAVPMNGLFFGGTITLSSANVLHVAAGMGIIGGRFFEVLESDISVQLSASGDLLGRLYIHLDLSNADNPISIETYTGASLPALSGDPNLNVSNGVFDMELCTFSINELTISNIIQTFPTITAANNQIRRATAYSVNDFALCQSASGSLIFVCTTAGTTAIQQPSAYQTVTDGNTVTDGTAVFKAVSVSGQITKLSKTEVLISNSGDAFDPTRPYKVGELCIYNNTLYRCITACSAGSWATNQSCFIQDTLVNICDSLMPKVYDVTSNLTAGDITREVITSIAYIRGKTAYVRYIIKPSIGLTSLQNKNIFRLNGISQLIDINVSIYIISDSTSPSADQYVLSCVIQNNGLCRGVNSGGFKLPFTTSNNSQLTVSAEIPLA